MTHRAYILHYAPDNASLVVRLALEEIGARYETRLVDRASNAQNSDSYIALNPNGLIPVLETPQGPIFETGAILLWLADRHDALGPGPDAPGRGDFLKWLFFLSNTLHPALRRIFYPNVYIGGSEADQTQLRRVAAQQVDKHLSVLDTRWRQSEPPCIALNIYLACMMRWVALYPANDDKSWFRLTGYSALHKAVQALETRPSTHAASNAEGLGPTPFTSPLPPNPPEGSPT